MNYALIPGLYEAQGIDTSEPSLSPDLSLPQNQTFYKGELLYVTGAKEDPHGGSRNPGNPNAYWVMQPINTPNEKKFAPAFPEGFKLLNQAEVRRVIDSAKHLKPQTKKELTELLD